jgi:hypothetical protein
LNFLEIKEASWTASNILFIFIMSALTCSPAIAAPNKIVFAEPSHDLIANTARLNRIKSNLFTVLNDGGYSDEYFRSPFAVVPVSGLVQANGSKIPTQGMLIVEIESNADAKGINVGDIILKVDNCSVGSNLDYGAVIAGLDINKDILFDVYRDGHIWSERVSLVSSPIKLDVYVESRISYESSYTWNENIYISNSLISLAESDDELAFLVAHEIGHHVYGHERREDTNIASLILGIGAAAVINGSSSTKVGYFNGYTGTELMPYEYAAEIAADEFAKGVISNSGYVITGAYNILSKVQGSLYEKFEKRHMFYKSVHTLDELRLEASRNLPRSNAVIDQINNPATIKGVAESYKYHKAGNHLGALKNRSINQTEFALRAAQIYRLIGHSLVGGMDGLVFNVENTDYLGWVGLIIDKNKYGSSFHVRGDLLDADNNVIDTCSATSTTLYKQPAVRCRFKIANKERLKLGLWRIKLYYKNALLDDRGLMMIKKPKGGHIKRKRSEIKG